MAEQKSEKHNCLLPLSRIKTIMKSSPDVTHVAQESLFVITKATELFVQDLAKTIHKKSGSGKSVSYKDLSTLVDEEENMQFLQDIIPKKILAKDYLDKQNNTESDDDIVMLD
ncbi:unnamed protein product [Owenia fusiformis]|uniref:Chromatin accessibility complex protein 1 n=1 Tax=Owenia fusiformis TaxID=6347 RepID=A0A8J1UCX5_OWEFU|nr:unnamed protein product [Owenia fusiformis]